jgi:hypothetical protein
MNGLRDSRPARSTAKRLHDDAKEVPVMAETPTDVLVARHPNLDSASEDFDLKPVRHEAERERHARRPR